MVFKREIELGGRTLSVEVGKVAKQSDGAAWVQYGDTVVLAAVNSRSERGDNTDFFPLTVDYREKKYGGGKIPGGFFKREARPHDKETLIARMTDRALRPLFAKGYYNETQVLLQVYSHDQENEGDTLAQIGATIALLTSDIPFETPVVNVRVGRIDGKLIVNPTIPQLEECDLEILVAGTEDAIAMVEGEGKEISEEEFLEALDFAHVEIKRLVEFVKEFQKELGKPTREWEPVVTTDEIAAAVKEQVGDRINELITIADKSARKARQKEIKVEIRETLAEQFPDQEKFIGWALEALVKDAMRSKVMADKVRIDSRKPDEIRPISVEAGVLPRAHGSSLFTRGQTQALGSCTLGTKIDEQKVDGLEGEFWRTFMLHYNFPPFCTGEVKRMFGTSRRELGHGNLAERALKATLPDWDDFPYTVRLVSEVLESNGSSSMASVCAGSLALMDCGVPVKKAVAGIAMGLIKEGDDFVILSDILGDEDALGDMDFKLAGTKDGITAFQMDIKIAGISRDIMAKALGQAKAGREHILGIMDSLLPEARPELSRYAPTILNITIDPEYIGMIIGPGGKMIRALQTDYGVNIEIDDDGTVSISSTSRDAADAVKDIIKNMTREPEIGEEFDAKVVKVVDFGAFVELYPGKEGLVHVSELEWKRVEKVSDVVKMGDTVRVKLVSKTNEGKLDLSRKALLPKPEGYVEREKRPPRPGGGNRGGGGGGGRRR
jgi:polyribonucleotide nucleotidyltransferase